MMQAVMWPVMKLFGLSCRQFAELAAIRMARDMTARESLRFQFHRRICGLCKVLPMQLENLRILTRCVCQEEESSAPPTTPDLSHEALTRIRHALAAEEERK